MSDIQSVPEFYAGRSIFITGATGFLGKILVEKLLRSCPDLKCLYLLIRHKKGKDSQERLEDVLESQVNILISFFSIVSLSNSLRLIFFLISRVLD